MDGRPSHLPDDLAVLKALLQQQQRTIEQQRKGLDRKQQIFVRSQKKLHASQQRVERFRENVVRKQGQIEHLEERLRRLLAHRFGQRSEKNSDQFQLFNEAELLAEPADDPVGDEVAVPAHTRKRKKTSHALPADLPRVARRWYASAKRSTSSWR
jgi:exonuclease VII large subunit